MLILFFDVFEKIEKKTVRVVRKITTYSYRSLFVQIKWLDKMITSDWSFHSAHYQNDDIEGKVVLCVNFAPYKRSCMTLHITFAYNNSDTRIFSV